MMRRMSERYGRCQKCDGYGSKLDLECYLCGGTGFDGAAELYENQATRSSGVVRVTTKVAMELAVLAADEFSEKLKR